LINLKEIKIVKNLYFRANVYVALKSQKNSVKAQTNLMQLEGAPKDIIVILPLKKNLNILYQKRLLILMG